ncbi:MAG: hypothetical protein NWE92_07445 [Candidatus Bathyarchaeota archaeon]|nr:hypothetical protein [Candidatus Bathyarchaeota archaeon]
MVSFSITLSAKWGEFLKGLSEEHDIDMGKVINGLCDWAFSNADYKGQFEVWLDTFYPQKGQAEDIAKAKGEAESVREQERQDSAEEEVHEDRDYSEDRELKS